MLPPTERILADNYYPSNDLAHVVGAVRRYGTCFAISDGGGSKFMDVATLTPSYLPTPGFQPQLGRSVTIDQAAGLLGCSRRTVYYRIRQGRLVTVRTIGGSQRVLLSSMAADRLAN